MYAAGEPSKLPSERRPWRFTLLLKKTLGRKGFDKTFHWIGVAPSPSIPSTAVRRVTVYTFGSLFSFNRRPLLVATLKYNLRIASRGRRCMSWRNFNEPKRSFHCLSLYLYLFFIFLSSGMKIDQGKLSTAKFFLPLLSTSLSFFFSRDERPPPLAEDYDPSCFTVSFSSFFQFHVPLIFPFLFSFFRLMKYHILHLVRVYETWILNIFLNASV